MFSPLLTSIIEREDLQVLDEINHDEMVGDVDYAVLLFAGDAARLAESDDVSVVLPELCKAFNGLLTPMVVARSAERPLQLKYHFNAYPSLVFLRLGEYLGTIQQVLDWTDYLNRISEILTREPSDPPPYRLPDGCGSSAQAGVQH